MPNAFGDDTPLGFLLDAAAIFDKYCKLLSDSSNMMPGLVFFPRLK